MDNVSAKAHVNEKGGTRSRLLMLEAERLFSWAECHILSIKANYISHVDNICVDWLSRRQIDSAEWQLHPLLFREITLGFDLFASPLNSQLPRFVTCSPNPLVEDSNALQCHWPPGLLYAFPPIPLIPSIV